MQENSHFTLTGPLIWCDNLQVRLWMILNINYNVSHYMGMSQMCAGAGNNFRPSKPHSWKLWNVMFTFVTNTYSRKKISKNKSLPKGYYLLLIVQVLLPHHSGTGQSCWPLRRLEQRSISNSSSEFVKIVAKRTSHQTFNNYSQLIVSLSGAFWNPLPNQSSII